MHALNLGSEQLEAVKVSAYLCRCVNPGGVFRHGDDNSIGITILKHQLQWLGYVLRMLSQRITHRGSFPNTGTDWKKRRWLVFDIMLSYERKLNKTGILRSSMTPLLGFYRWCNTVT